MTVEDEVRLVDSMIDLYAAAHRHNPSKSNREVIDAAVPDVEALKAYTHKRIEQCRYRGKQEKPFCNVCPCIATSRRCADKSVRLCATAVRVCYSAIQF